MENNRFTPIQYLEKEQNAEIWLKREDLLPFSFGGNKVRILQEVFAEMKAKGYDALITYGSTSSNLNRVAAHMAAKENVPLSVIVKSEKDPQEKAAKPGETEEGIETDRTAGSGGQMGFNEKMLQAAGARILTAEPDRVRETVEEAIAGFLKEGRKPYYIYGDSSGQGNEEVLSRAYRKVFSEILEQEKETGKRFDTIVLPVGTGATLSGLAAACDEDHRIFGISIARSRETVLEKLQSGLRAAGLSEEEIKVRMSRVDVTDAYLMGGYGCGGRELMQELLSVFRKQGLPMDPVYTGKAFHGMTEEIKKDSLRGNVLFLHTGGLPLFFDMLHILSGASS